jgi:hypothetical protein
VPGSHAQQGLKDAIDLIEETYEFVRDLDRDGSFGPRTEAAVKGVQNSTTTSFSDLPERRRRV